MVSRRNFFTITMIMIVVWFMFQIPEVIKNQVNHYDKNEYEESTDTGLTAETVHMASKDDGMGTGRFVVYIGDEEDGAVGSVVKQWCFYTKRYLQSYQSIAAYRPAWNSRPEAVLIDFNYVDIREDITALVNLTERGINLIFCNLPDASVMANNPRFRNLIGVRQVISFRTEVEGIRLIDGFLLGGLKEYKLDETMEETQQDMQLIMPWYRMAGGTKVYMCGMLPDEKMEEYEFMKNGDAVMKSQNLPAVIWRKSLGEAMVFAVNGDYISGNAGMGILSAMMSEMKEYDVYPIINAQNLVVVNFPDLTNENEDEMMERYSQSLKAVYRDIVWPGLVSVAQQNSYKMTCLIMPQREYKDELNPEEDMLIYYMKLFQEQSVETGLSGEYSEDVNLSDKLDNDMDFLNHVIPDYKILSLYQGNMTDKEVADTLKRGALSKTRTVLSDYEDNGQLLSYYWGDVIRQMGISDGYSHTFSENLRMLSIETALGYSNIQVDVNPVAFPVTDEDSWEKLSRDFAGNTSTYWKKFRKFEKTTLSESNAHVQRFLALNYTQERVDNKISLHISGFDEEAWFMLRTHGEAIKDAKGASFEKVEDDVYLVTATESEVQLEMEEAEPRFYYMDN